MPWASGARHFLPVCAGLYDSVGYLGNDTNSGVEPGLYVGRLGRKLGVSFSNAQHHPALATTTTKLYRLETEAHRCEQLARRRYAKMEWPGIEPATSIANQTP